MTRGRAALLLAAPVLIVLAGQIAAGLAARASPASNRARLEAHAAAVIHHLERLLAEAGHAAERARDLGPDAVHPLPAVLAQRLEGAGVIRNGRFARWTGTPAEPSLFGGPDGARIVSRGMRTSLLVASAADPSGGVGAVSFTLDLATGTPRAAELLPSGDGIDARWDFADRRAAAPPAGAASASMRRPLTWKGRAPLATIVFEETPPSSRAARIRALTLAWAALAFAGIVAALLARRPGPVSGPRTLLLSAGIIAVRIALAWGRTFEELLPRTLGSPSLYGRGDGFGLLGSPAALLATAVCAALIATSIARALIDAPASTRRRFVVPAAVLSAASIVGIVLLAGSLARDARVAVPRLDPTAPGSFLLALAAAVFLAGVAELAATVVLIVRSAASPGRASRLAVAAALVPLSVLFLAQLYRASGVMVDERLRSEFAPLVLEQSARRRVALTSAIGQAAAEPGLGTRLALESQGADPDLAYRLWIGSDLFHEGFASSIDLYDANDERVGHFGFGLPQVGGDRESRPRPVPADGGPFVETESVAVGATLLRVLHAEAMVPDPAGGPDGRVVGHVLEDPSNLPFLPANAPYLEALGGSPVAFDAPAAEVPDYVLFDADGRVVLTTLRRPPAASATIRAAAARMRPLDVVTGDMRYRALPLAEDHRVHLLLVPAPTVLGASADLVRVLLLAVAVLAGAAIIRMLAGSGGLSELADVVRGSFYRKVLAAVLVASVVPLVALSLFLRTYIDRRGEASLADSAAAVIGAARRVVEDYQTVGEDDPSVPRLRINDQALWWLRRVVGQEIHVYEDGAVAATSKPELFDSALIPQRLPGDVERDVVRGGQPVVVRTERLGAHPLPVAYARVEERGGPADAVIAVPLVLEQRAFARSAERLVELLLLATTALVLLLAASAAWIARSVADPVRRLADASRRIAGGDYEMRLAPSTRDEMGTLVTDFNRMAGALAGQRADLLRRRDYIEALLRYATTGVVSTDALDRVVTINPAAEALLSGEEGAPEPGASLTDALRRSEATAPLAAALSGRDALPGVPLEVDLGAGEHLVRLRWVRVPLPDPYGGEPGTLLLIDDVTSLMKSNQLAAWAEMARAIAHEIKNPLTPIQLSAEHVRKLLSDRGVPSPEIDACLDTIVRNVRELRDISGAFSTYARIPELALAPVDPAEFLRGIAAPYRTAPPPGIRIEERYDPAPKVLADTKLLARAVVNLIENAIQAMPHGGTLTVASAADGAGAVVLAVADTGEGLTPDARARLFEPYFSTKSAGTGLGLAIARRVVLGHGGSIDVESAPGKGTTFSIRLKEA